MSFETERAGRPRFIGQRTPEGMIDYGHYRAAARQEREAAMAAIGSNIAARIKSLLSRPSAPRVSRMVGAGRPGVC
jgi:hypothetical protein